MNQGYVKQIFLIPQFHQRFENEGIVKLLYDWTKCYTLMSLISKHDADVFKKAVLSEIDSTGGHRAINNRQNYYMEFSATTGRFLSQKIIGEHNMFCLTDLSLKYYTFKMISS